jgi:NarL family two-component system response regulator YdfI
MTAALSPREIEILHRVALGETSKEIAMRLGIRERTVNWHLARVYSKLGATSRAEAVAIAVESGIVRRIQDTRTEP